MHSGRIVKLCPDRFNIFKLADHVITIGRYSSDKLHFVSDICVRLFGLVVTMKLNLSSSLGNMQPENLTERFGILTMLLGNLSIPFPFISN